MEQLLAEAVTSVSPEQRRWLPPGRLPLGSPRSPFLPPDLGDSGNPPWPPLSLTRSDFPSRSPSSFSFSVSSPRPDDCESAIFVKRSHLLPGRLTPGSRDPTSPRGAVATTRRTVSLKPPQRALTCHTSRNGNTHWDETWSG